MLDPPPGREAAARLSFARSGKIATTRPGALKRAELGLSVLKAQKAGEKKYLAVPRVAAENGCSERYVWEAIKEFEGGPIRDLAEMLRIVGRQLDQEAQLPDEPDTEQN
jgi:hypothetical protein